MRPHYNVDWFEYFDMRRSLNMIYRFGHNRFELGARGESRGDIKGYSVTGDFRVTGYEILVFEDIEISGNWEALIMINGVGVKCQNYP